MDKRVLVPLDGSAQSLEAVDFAVSEFSDATITLFHVIDPIEGGYTVRTGIPISSEEWYEEARTIVEHAKDDGFDHIVMGSHGRSGVSRILLGSVAEKVVRSSTVPVTVVR